MPGEDLHLSVMAPLQAHSAATRFARQAAKESQMQAALDPEPFASAIL